MKWKFIIILVIIIFQLVFIQNVFYFKNASSNSFNFYKIGREEKIFPSDEGLPTSNHPDDIVMTIFQSKNIGWILLDVVGEGKYRVLVNDTNDNYYIWVDWTDWENNSNLNIPINITMTGIFNYTIEYNNSGGLLGLPDMVIINIFNISNLEPVWSQTTGDWVESVSISAQGHFLVSGSNNYKVHLFNRTSSNPIWNYTTENLIWSVAISSNGQYITAGSADKKVYLFNRNDSNPVWNFSTGATVKSVAISADGQYIVAGSDRLYLFNNTSSEPILNYSPGAIIQSVSISADGQYIIATDNYYIHLLNRSSPIPIWTSYIPIEIVKFSANGQYIVGGSKEDKIYFFNRNSPTPLWSYQTGSDVVSIDISADGQFVIAGSRDNKTYLFYGDNNTPIWSYEIEDDVISVSISSDGQYIAVGGQDKNFYLFNNTFPIPIYKYSTDSIIRSVMISGDGQYAVVGNENKKVYLFHQPKNPTSNQPMDFLTSTLNSRTINWSLYDVFAPGEYRVWTNDSNNNYYIWRDWASWDNDTDLQIPINRTSTGIFNYTIEYNNSENLFGIPDTIIITIIQSQSPFSNHPENITTTASGLETINWTLYDEFVGGEYRVWLNSSDDKYYIWKNWTPWINNTPLYIQINRTISGFYNYTIEYYDIDNLYGISDTVMVNLTDDPPFSNHPININTSANGLETINWTLYDDFEGGKYQVWSNDTNNNYYLWINWTSWNSSAPLNVPINRTYPGIYNYTIEFYDIYNHFGISDSVIVTIEDKMPTCNSPIYVTTTLSSSDTIQWILYDDFGPGYYQIWVNDTQGNFYIWRNWTMWSNNTPIIIPINRTAIGIFNYTIEYNSSTGQITTNTVFVTINLYIPILESFTILTALEKYANVLNPLFLVVNLGILSCLIFFAVIIISMFLKGKVRVEIKINPNERAVKKQKINKMTKNVNSVKKKILKWK